MLPCINGVQPSRIVMLYAFHELAYQSALPFRIGAQMARQFWTSPFNPASDTAIGRTAYASAELFESVTRRYGKPAWRLETIDIEPTPRGDAPPRKLRRWTPILPGRPAVRSRNGTTRRSDC